MGIGIDKITLIGFKVKSIDYAKLLSDVNTNKVNIKTGRKVGRTHRIFFFGDTPIEQIHIMDNEKFLDLRLGVQCIKNMLGIEYCHLTLTVTHRNGDNLESLSISEYTTYLQCVITYIYDYYGIDLEITDAVEFKYLEIACTSNISLQEMSFLHLGTLFMHFLPKTYRLQSAITDLKEHYNDEDYRNLSYEKSKLPNAYCKSNNSIEFMIYKKKPKCEKDTKKSNIKNGSTIVRFEIRLKTSSKVKQFLGTASLHEITDDMIQQKYLDYIEKNIHKKWILWKKETHKHLRRIFSETRKNHPYQWIHYLLGHCVSISWKNQIPFIIDVSQIIDALPSNKALNNNKARIIKTIRRQMQEKGYTYWLADDLSMIDTLFDTVFKR